MSMTRREMVTGSGLLLIGAACSTAAGAEPLSDEDHQKPPVKVRTITLRLEGMIAPVLTSLKSKPGVPVAVDFALMDVLAEGDKDIVDLHVPTLAIPRMLLSGVPSIAPHAVDGHDAYWLIAGSNVDIVSTGTDGLKVNAPPLPKGKNEPTTLAKEWSTLAWLADMDVLYAPKTISSQWRRHKVVNTIVRVSAGAEVEPQTAKFENEDMPVGVYRLQRVNKEDENRDERVYKHFIRTRVAAPKGVRLEISSRVPNGRSGSIGLSAAPDNAGHQEIRVSNMPVRWRKREPKQAQPDTRTFGALFGIPREERFESAFVRVPDEGRSDGCDCCVPQKAQQTLDTDQLPPLKDA